MARKQDDDLLIDDELTAAFLGDDQNSGAPAPEADDSQDDWSEDDNVPGQLAIDVYETPEDVIVQTPIAGINKGDLDVSISDNTLSIQGTRTSGSEVSTDNYFLQECFWGDFSRSITLPVPVKEDEVDAVLKDGVLTVKFKKVKQNTVKKINIG